MDIDPAEIGKNRLPQVAIIGDIKHVIIEILDYADSKSIHQSDQTLSWKDRISLWKYQYPLLVPSHPDHLSPQEIISYISKVEPNAYFTTDVGQHQMWAAQFLNILPRHWMSSAGLGTMGYGLPAAVGTQIAHPLAKVICISGDASFQMNLQELATISQYDLPIKVVIINNKWQGMVRQWQQAFYNHTSLLARNRRYCNKNIVYLLNVYKFL